MLLRIGLAFAWAAHDQYNMSVTNCDILHTLHRYRHSIFI